MKLVGELLSVYTFLNTGPHELMPRQRKPATSINECGDLGRGQRWPFLAHGREVGPDANAALRQRRGELIERCSGSQHRSAGDDPVPVGTQDPPADAPCQSEVVRVHDEDAFIHEVGVEIFVIRGQVTASRQASVGSPLARTTWISRVCAEVVDAELDRVEPRLLRSNQKFGVDERSVTAQSHLVELRA